MSKEDDYALRPASPEEEGLFYAKTPEKDAELGAIGYLRMDFGRGGTQFWTTWFDEGCGELNTPEFKAEIDEVVNTLRKSVLKDRASMRRVCWEHGGLLSESYGMRQYGYCLETEHYRYCLRCKPQEGDYDGYLWCYDKRIPEMAMKENVIGRIRFFDAEELEYTDPDKYVAAIKEALACLSPMAIRCETLTDDPRVRKAVDDALYEVCGEENPRTLEEYFPSPAPTLEEMESEENMNASMSREQVQRIREQYPPGTRIRLYHMEDAQAVPEGTEGTVVAVDDMGQIHMKWDNGRTLALIPGEDSFSAIRQRQDMTMQMGGM